MSKAELNIAYDNTMKPVSAMCTGCRETMPQPPVDLQQSADVIEWFSQKYIEHRNQKHSQDDGRV